MNDVQIQIVNYKTKGYLLECIASFIRDLAGSEITYSLEILDNASGDDLSDIPSLYPNIEIHIHYAKENRGFGAGHNRLASYGDSEYLLFLNPDTKCIESRTVERLLKDARESSVGIVGPRLEREDGSTQEFDHGELHGLFAQIALSTGNSHWKRCDEPSDVAWVNGATLLIKRKLFKDLGGFDERFFLYKEDEELCWRLRQKGETILYDPTIRVLHYGSVVAKKSEHMQQSVDYFLKKHFKNRLRYPILLLLNNLLH